jgi:hypothetical protein
MKAVTLRRFCAVGDAVPGSKIEAVVGRSLAALEGRMEQHALQVRLYCYMPRLTD